jgi:IclR family pca regulon transcriptional regulator
MRETVNRDSEHVLGLEKGLAVVEAFGARHPRLTLSEVAALTGLSRASARRCLLTLQRLGYAQFDGKYFRLAPRVLRLGHAYLSSNSVPRVVQPVLESLTERVHESASVAILDGTDVVFVARSTARRSLSNGVGIGTRLPVHCTATGRVLLSAFDDAHVRALLESMERRALTPNTLTDVPALVSEVRRARKSGYAISDQEIEIGLRSIAVPVRDSVGATVAAMSLAARANRVSRADLVAKLLPVLESSRRALTSAL